MNDAEDKKKRPAFQFYPADWRKDVRLRSCSVAARGLWIDLMCVMHDCEPYGHLALNGRPMTPENMAGQIGVAASTIRKLLAELLETGVARQLPDGTVYSKRMVEDERVRNARAEGGKAGSEHGIKGAAHGVKGGRPAHGRGVSEPPSEPPLEPPPSSSSSSSSSIEPHSPRKRGPGLDPEGFARFWDAYPRKVSKAKALQSFGRLKPTEAVLAQMLEAIAAQSRSEQWTKDGGAFIPHPATWLNGRRWEDELPVAIAQPAPDELAQRRAAEAAEATARLLAQQKADALAARTPEAEKARHEAMRRLGGHLQTVVDHTRAA